MHISQIHNFGQTPRKLFGNAHPQKKVPKLVYNTGTTDTKKVQ